jgi:hypothetical protein
MAKKVDLKAKQKRQKILAVVLGVVLVGVLAFQLPRTLKLLRGSSASASPPASTTAPGSPLPPASTGGASSGSSGGVSDPGVSPAPRSGQLLAFSRFRSKDPFAQQLGTGCTDTCTSTSGGTTGPAGATGPGGTGTGTGGTSPPAGGGNTSPPAPPAHYTSAVISINGAAETVSVGAQFPASSPTFRLVSLTKRTAKIGIAGGSLEGGMATVTLKKNVPLTLMNTADGTRYVLRLISVGAGAADEAAPPPPPPPPPGG